MKIKKILTLFLCLSLTILLFTSCAEEEKNVEEVKTQEEQIEEDIVGIWTPANSNVLSSILGFSEDFTGYMGNAQDRKGTEFTWRVEDDTVIMRAHFSDGIRTIQLTSVSVDNGYLYYTSEQGLKNTWRPVTDSEYENLLE